MLAYTAQVLILRNTHRHPQGQVPGGECCGDEHEAERSRDQGIWAMSSASRAPWATVTMRGCRKRPTTTAATRPSQRTEQTVPMTSKLMTWSLIAVVGPRVGSAGAHAMPLSVYVSLHIKR